MMGKEKWNLLMEGFIKDKFLMVFFMEMESMNGWMVLRYKWNLTIINLMDKLSY